MKQENIFASKPFLLKGSNNIGILLLHGWTSPAAELLPLAKYLNSSGYTVYAPLLRGHGTRPEDLDCVRWKDWLEDARRALRELEKNLSLTKGAVNADTKNNSFFQSEKKSLVRDETKIFIGGISMGGDLAMHLSEEESVAGVISLGAAVKYKLHPLVKIALFFMGLTKKYRRKYYPPWVRKKMGSRKVYMYYPIESAKEVVRLADATRAILPRITKPILIMQSTSDHMVSKKSPQIILDGVNSKIKEISWVKDGYHVFVENKIVWEKIGKFIKNVQ